MSSIIAEYHQSVKERKYRYLFVYECREAAKMIPKKSMFDFQEIVMAAGARFLNHIDYHLLYQHLYPGSSTPYLRIDMPSAMIIVEWYAKKRPFPKEWDTERLKSDANYYIRKKEDCTSWQGYVNSIVRKNLEHFQKFFEEQEKENESRRRSGRKREKPCIM